MLRTSRARRRNALGGVPRSQGLPAFVGLLLLGATYTMVFWLPTLIQSWGVKDLLLIGIYSAIPNAFGVIGMILIGRIGPVVSPSIDGWIVQHTGSTTYALYLVMALYVLSGVLVLVTVYTARSRLPGSDLRTPR